MESSMLRSDFGDLLVHGDGVAVRRAKFSAGQPNLLAVVVVAESSGVMHTADRRNHLAVLLQRHERPGKRVILARCGDLVIKRVDAVRDVDEGAAPGSGGLFCRSK